MKNSEEIKKILEASYEMADRDFIAIAEMLCHIAIDFGLNNPDFALANMIQHLIWGHQDSYPAEE